MNEQLLKDFLATAKKDNYNWDVILPKFPELKDYDLRLLKDYAATAKKDNYDYSIINPKFPEFNLEKQEGGEPVNFTEGSVEPQEQPTEPLKKPIVDVDLFGAPKTDDYLAGPRREQEEYLKSVSGLISEEDSPSSKLVSQYSAYDPIQLDSALIDIGKRKQILQSNIRGPGISKREKLNKLEEEYAAAIVYKAEKTNDYDLSDDARRAVIDIGHSSPLGKKLRPEVYKLENRISEDIFKEVESRGVEFYSLTEEDYNGVRRADAEKVGVLADEIAESIAKGNPGVRQVAYEKIFERAENEEEIKMNEEKIKSDPEIQDVFSRYKSEGLDEFESTNKDGIKYKAEYTSAANAINKSVEFKLNKLTTDYNSDVNSYKQDLISQREEGVITPEEAEKQLGDYNKQLYSDLQNTQNLIIQNRKLNLQELTTEYFKKIEGGFKEFLQNNPMDPDDLQKLNDAFKRIGEEVDKDRFGKLKDQEMMSIYKYGATALIPLLGKSLNSTLSRSISGSGTLYNQPWMVELGDEMNTLFSVADERVEDWSDLANIPAVTKSIGRLAGSALPSILVGAAVSASTGGLGTIPAMAAVAMASGLVESVDMAGNIKRDVIRETGSLLKGEQAAGAMWEAQLGNWWTYIFDGLPYVGKALRGISSKAARIGIVGFESSGIETIQETRQTAQEQQIMQTVFDETEITAKGFSDRINQKLVKETFLEVGPGSFALGGGGRAVTEFMMDRQADKLVKEMVAKTRAGLVDDNESFIRQKIFASMNQFGKNFTNSWLSTLQKNGSITEEDLNRLYTYSKTAEGFLRNINGLNLTEEQNNTYFALSHRANELYNQAESITDDKVTRSTITEQANALKKNAQEFLNNPETGGSFVSVQIGKGPALIMNEEQAIEFVTNNPYVAFPEAGINIQGRNVDEFTKMFSEMVEGTKAGLADVKSIDEYSNQQREEGRLSSVDNTLTKINNAEYINDNEIDSSIDQIFDEIDRVDGLDISDNAKESIKQQLFSIAEILDNHEFRTKTETRKVTPKESAEGGAETKREIPKKSTSKAELAGVGTVSVTFTGGNTISITPQGQKGRAARVTKFTFPENFLYTNEQGDFTALIIEDAEGNEITINDPEIGVPLAINNIIAETAAVPTDVVEEFVTEEINYIKERKEAAPEASTQVAPTQVAPTTTEETITEEDIDNALTDEIIPITDLEVTGLFTHQTRRPDAIISWITGGKVLGYDKKRNKDEDLNEFTEDFETTPFATGRHNRNAPNFQEGGLYGGPAKGMKFVITRSGKENFTPNLKFSNKKSFDASRGVGVPKPNSRNISDFTFYKVTQDGKLQKIDISKLRNKVESITKTTKKETTTEEAPVEESTTEGVESSEGLTEEAESELRKLMGLDKSKRKASREGNTEKDNQRLDKVERAVDLLKKSLSKVMPNIFIDVAESSEQFALFAEEEGYKKRDLSQGISRKMPVPDSKTFEEEWVIILNPDSADVTTVFHEGLHAVLRASGLSEAQARAVTGRMIEAVKKTATKRLQRELEEFTDMYKTPQQNEEYIAELIGILANNYNEQNSETKSLIRRWLEKLAEILGLKPKGAPLSSVGLGKTDAATVNMLNVLAEKMSRGKVLSKEDVTSLRMGGPLTVQQVAADMRMDEEQGGSGQVGNFNFKRKKSKAPSVEDDTRSSAKNTIQKDLTTYAGQNFVTNMYDFTNYGPTDIGGGIVLELYGGKNYVAYMMERTGTKLGEVSNVAAFNSKENAEGFIKNAIDGKANLFAPHVGTKEGSWQFQQNIFEQLVEKLLDNNVITNEELIESFNSGLNSKDGKKALRIFNEKNKTNLTNLNDFIENPKKLVELLDIDNNYSADLRKILNDRIASNKKVQKFLGVTNKIEFAELLEDPMNVGSKPFDLIGIIEFDNTTFEEPSRPKKGDADYHPSFAWTVKAKITAIVQPTYFYQSTESTDSYTKFNQDGVVVSRPTDLKDSKGRSLEKLYKTALKDTRKYKINEQGKKVVESGKAPFDGTFEDFQKSKFKSSNVASSAGSLPKVATVKPTIRKQKRRTERLAPNGKRSNLNDIQYDTVRTPAFKNWFGDWENDPKNASKVVDENGEPLVVYHGTAAKDVEVFKKGENFRSGGGIYFTNSIESAKTYDRDPTIYAAFLNVKNPRIENANNRKWVDVIGGKAIWDIVKESKSNNYNGVIIKNIVDSGGFSQFLLPPQDNYIAFKPNQIKLADGSNKTFDPDASSIRKQKKKKPKSKIKDAFEYGIQKGIPAINIKNWLIKLGYTEEEVDSGAYDAERIWNKDGKKVKNWFEYARRSALSARKFRPQSMFLAQEAMESAISAELRQAKMMAESLNSAINRYKSQDKRDELIDAVDEFMRDAEERDFWRDELPDEIAQIAEAMRIHIDSLSLKLVEVGAIKAESSRENILKNIGVYMNRSFEIFDNKNWKKEVGDQVITAAQNHLREVYYNSLSGINELDQQLKDDKITESDYNRRKKRILANKASVKKIMDRDGVTEDEALTMHVEKVVDDILTRKDVDEYISFAQSVVGKKDLSSLKRRKDIPPAIRALMGEYTDPGYNYAMSIFKIANLVENQKYLTKIRDAGLGVWLFEDEAGIKKREGYKQITFDGDASMNPLDGLYAPEAVADAFNDKELSTIISGIPVIGTTYKNYLKLVGGVKYTKTILSLGTHGKNVIGNMYFMAQNGYLDPREYQQPFMVLAKQFAGKELTAEQEAKMDEWIRAGIIGQGASIGEIKSIFEGEDSFEKALSKRIDKKTDNMLSEGKKARKWVGKKAQEAYQYEDDMFKIVAYEKEKLNYSKILFDGKSYNQLDASQKSAVNDYVAEIIKNILPNYGRIGGFGKFLKAVPVAGTFISFQLEAYRTAYNTVGLAMQEIKGDIPGISEAGKKLAQKRGAKRLASIVGFQAFKYGMIALLGIPLIPGDDDDEDGLSERIRMLLPFWDTNSDIAIQDVKPNGNFTYVSVSASDPYGSIFKVVNATTNYAKTGEGFSEIFEELTGPFISDDILLNTLMNIKSNENDYGGKIVRNTDTLFEASEKIALQLYKTFEPGSLTSTRKIAQSENKLNEVIGQFTGFKLHEIKSLEQAGFKFREIQNEAQESKKAYNSVKYNIDDYETQEEINKVIRASKKAMDKDYKEAVKLYQALISLGVSKRDIRAKMDDAGISSTMRSQIARNSIDVKLNAIKK